MEQLTGNVVRVSIGYFPSDKTEQIEAMTNNEFKNAVVPAVKKLNGNLGFYVGIDKQKHAISNVSFWQSQEDAAQMNTLKEMLDMKVVFEAVGVNFIAITNATINWEV
ncbi:hypothetical protein HDF24_02675 [Mucilaginibacter sp. X4EP1]|uniref:hypothetical protein n=1 Tax=Mucilaginibacter sp. X4EP1 TaxID=2723092 RepID=UPI00216A5ABC|nr:hypothetical protein [Mucilaginibacter sp. X4EP1]MCS3811924.1 RNA binding exosome subunit [Mucilaginibacter sp. X4EP1]